MNFIKLTKEKAKQKKAKIVYAESKDSRVLKAISKLSQEQIVHPILIVDDNENQVYQSLEKYQSNFDGLTIVNPKNFAQSKEFGTQLFQLRKHKGMSLEQAIKAVKNPLTFAYLYLDNNLADGAVNGATYTTAEVIRQAIQIIGTQKNNRLVSSYFIMILEKPINNHNFWLFADCAININPDSEQLLEIAKDTINSYKNYSQGSAKVAMLSFSTQGSANHPDAKKVAEATELLQKKFPDVAIDGEIQFDAAVVDSIAEQKYNNSSIKGNANIFIFPNLSAANISYKIAQRLGNCQAIGPIFQGLNKPINDLSRGCSIEDIINISALTALQS